MESLKNECKGIAGSFCFLLYSDLFFFFCTLIFSFADLFLLPGLALQVEKQKLLEGLEEMKTTVRNSHNRADEVITCAEEELALAKLIRHGADRDLV